jgi:CHAT domain-containing protein/tetratricopeptide (TPR) repeat protein
VSTSLVENPAILPRLKSACHATATLLCLAVPVVLLPLSSSLLPALAQTTQEQNAEADQLLQDGQRLIDKSLFREALEKLQQALAIYRQVQNRDQEVATLNEIGRTYERLSDYEKMGATYQQALVIAREIGNRQEEGNALNGIGDIYFYQSDYPKANEFYEQALLLFQAIKYRKGEAQSLNKVGITYHGLGQYSKALEFYQQASTIRQQIGDRFGEGQSLTNLGGIYDSLGQYPKALEFYQQALAIFKEVGDRWGEGYSLNNIGSIYYSLGQYPKALEFYQQALAIRKEIGDRFGEGTMLNNIGLIYDDLGQYPKALEFYQQALAIHKEVGNRSMEGTTLNNIGLIYRRVGQYPKALEFYQQALAILKEIGDRSTEGITLNNIGYLLEAQKQPELAIVFLKQSVSTWEAIREDLRILPREQQQSYTETVASTYRRLADILLQQDRILEAQQVLELLKVQELEDYLRNVRGNPGELTVLRPEEEILQRYNELQKTAIQVGKELTELRQLKAKTPLTSAQEQRLGQLVELETQINRQFNDFIESEAIQQLTEQLSRTAQKQNLNLEDLNALRDNLQKLDAVLLYPLILEDRLELVITTPNAPPIRRTVKNLKREDLNRVIAEFRSALQSPKSDAKASAQQLYQWLIKPIEADLQQAKAKTIIYAPDGQLRYIPPAALHDGKDWLAQRYRINNITARSVTDFTTPPQKQLRVFAGAFGVQPRTIQVGTNQFPFAGLPFTVKEVQALNQLIPGTKNLIAQDFSRAETVKQLNNFNVVHLATHGKFVVGQAADSFIALGNGDHIPLPEIKNLSLTNVDLIVLSACETGIGDQLGNGEEILGLGYQFQRAGARAVIASLWQVDDGGTQVLMNAFYYVAERHDQSSSITGSSESFNHRRLQHRRRQTL